MGEKSNNYSPAVILLAAGKSERMGKNKNKNYMFVGGKPVLARSIHAFLQLDLFTKVIVVLAEGEEHDFRKWVLSPFFGSDERIQYVTGGEKRQHSVYNGLKALNEEGISGESVICIHDGARPLVDTSLIRNVYNEAITQGAVVPGVPLQDTIKEVDSSDIVVNTPPRENYVSIQTPQCFKLSHIFKAHIKAEEEGFLGSDDSVLVERMGGQVKVIPGHTENIKLTTSFDFTVAEAILQITNDSFAEAEVHGEEEQFFLGKCSM